MAKPLMRLAVATVLLTLTTPFADTPNGQGLLPRLLPAIPACRHDEGEKPADLKNREQALEMARAVVRSQRDNFRSLGRYETQAALKVAPPPVGFELRLLTDGASFLFSIKDTRDSCGFGIFSDESGVLYQGSPKLIQMAGS